MASGPPWSSGSALDFGTGVLFLALQMACFWPVWCWTAARLGDGSGEGAAIIACALALLVRRRGPLVQSTSSSRVGLLGLPIGLTLAYASITPWVPPMVAAAIAYLALLATWTAWRDGRRPHLAAAGLVLLALPALPTAQYIAGFPLRVATGEIAVALLGAVGIATHREGVALVFADRLVAIDAPCSGLHMAWTALLLAAALALFSRLSALRSSALLAVATALAIFGNGVRAAALAFVETPGLLAFGPSSKVPASVAALFAPAAALPTSTITAGLATLPVPDRLFGIFASHDAIGLICFGLTVAPLPWLARRLGKVGTKTVSIAVAKQLALSRLAAGSFAAACLLAAASGFIDRPPQPRETVRHNWPTTFAGHSLVALPLADRDRRFAEGFPGEIQSFALVAPPGTAMAKVSTRLLLRWVDRPTRLLHPAAECLLATGWTVTPAPLERDPDGNLWSITLAHRAGERLVLRERIEEANGRGGWTDPSSWYWSTLFGRGEGPWLAWTVIEPA